MHHASNIVASSYVITTQFDGATKFIGVEKLTRRRGRIAAPGNSTLIYISPHYAAL